MHQTTRRRDDGIILWQEVVLEEMIPLDKFQRGHEFRRDGTILPLNSDRSIRARDGTTKVKCLAPVSRDWCRCLLALLRWCLCRSRRCLARCSGGRRRTETILLLLA